MITKMGKKILKSILKDFSFQYKKTSFSQSGEDLIINFIFKVRGITRPSYLDIGAHHPFFMSNTALFYLNGSQGINIEPDPYLFEAFRGARKKDINLNVGIADKKEVKDFYLMSSKSLNTFSKIEALRYPEEGTIKIEEVRKVKVTTLQYILEEYANNKFPDFLNVDAEGVDDIIIKQIDFQNNFPLVICIETISFSNSGNGVKNQKLIDFIIQQGYVNYGDTNINTIFVREEFWKTKKL